MIIIAIAVTALVISGTLVYMQYFTRRRLLVSTTTSLWETGLLNEVEAAFESKYPIDIQFTPAGTGIALEQAKSGDVDAVLVHSPSQELPVLQQGYVVSRKILAYNFFTIVGPQIDPANITGSNSTEALKRIADYGRTQEVRIWVSRGDNSGTHTKEQSLWKSAGFDYNAISNETDWYVIPGGTMGETLLKANEFSAYTLSDIGTYLKYFEKDARINLVRFTNERYELLNVYSVMAVNQTRHEKASINDAVIFIKFLVSDEGQQLIENYGKTDFGASGRLFHATVQIMKQNSTQMAQWIQNYATKPFGGTECPPEYRDPRYPELYN